MFPLATVLFPGLVLPLHIFEDRYRALVRHLMALPDGVPREFGVVAIRSGGNGPLLTPGGTPPSGSAVTNPPAAGLPPAPGSPPAAGAATMGTPPAPVPVTAPVTLHDVGCTAQLQRVTELPDGRFDLVTVGRRRFRVVELDENAAPYLVAEVEWLPEPAGQEEVADLLAPRVLATFRQYLRLLRAAPDDVAEQLPDDPTVFSHLVAATAALSLADRQSLLAIPDTAARLRAELRLLNRELVLLRQVRAVPVSLADLASPASPN